MDFNQQIMTVYSGSDQDNQCPCCGVYPGQYHWPDCVYRNNSDDEKEEQE